MRFFALAAALLYCFAAHAEPREYHARSRGELDAALEQAEPGATILLEPGHYDGPLQFKRDVTLRGVLSADRNPAHPQSVILDSTHWGPVIMVLPGVHVKLQWLKLVGGNGFGAAIVAREGSTLEMHEVEMRHNEGGAYALMEIDGTVMTEASTINDNVAASLVSLGKEGRVTFLGTSAARNGAAVFATMCKSANITINGGEIETAEHKPFAYVLSECPTPTNRVNQTESKLNLRSMTRPLMGAEPGLIDVDGAWLNGTRIRVPR